MVSETDIESEEIERERTGEERLHLKRGLKKRERDGMQLFHEPSWFPVLTQYSSRRGLIHLIYDRSSYDQEDMNRISFALVFFS